MKNFNDFAGFSLESNETSNILGGCGSYGGTRSNSCNPCQPKSNSCGGGYTRPERNWSNCKPVHSCFNLSFSFGCGTPRSCTPAADVVPPVAEEIINS